MYCSNEDFSWREVKLVPERLDTEQEPEVIIVVNLKHIHESLRSGTQEADLEA